MGFDVSFVRGVRAKKRWRIIAHGREPSTCHLVRAAVLVGRIDGMLQYGS